MKLHFGHLLGFSALAIAGCAAYFSVYGIGKLFQGAFWAVVIMASALELGKLVAASFLQRYRKTASTFMKTYLIICVTFLMIITSGGIYGFLSSAYQDTFQQLTVNENEITFLETKKKFFEDDVARYDKELEQINNNITKLSEQGVNSIQVRDTTSDSGVRNTISTAGLRAAQARIDVEEENKTKVRERRNIAADSLQKYQLQILNKENDVAVSGELGPLKYVANLTGVPMDKVVNWFILLFIFVFDPLAVTLVIATNWVFEKEGLKRRKDDDEPKVVKEKRKWKNPLKKIFKSKAKSVIKVEALKQEQVDKALTQAKAEAKNEVEDKVEPTKEEITEIKEELTKKVEDKVEDKVEPKTNNDSIILKAAKSKADEPELKSGVINNQGLVSAQPKQPDKTQITAVKGDGIKREEIKEIRQNQTQQTKKRGFSRNIPVRRGY